MLIALPSPKSFAAKWDLTTDLTVRETYTNNVALSSPPESDLITQITPRIRALGKGLRFIVDVNYAPSVIHYARRSDADTIANNLRAYGRVEAIERFFFIEANGNIAQNFISPVAPRPDDLTTISNNRIETRTFGLSPYIRGESRGNLSYELRNRNLWTTTDNSLLGHVHANQWLGRLAGPQGLVSWALEYDQSATRYEQTTLLPEQDSRLYRGRLYFTPDIAWRFSLSAGGEKNNYALQQERSYRIYGSSISWRPSPRTTADLEVERRFFGPSRLARFKHRTRLTAWNVTYSRNAYTFQQELGLLPPGDTAALLDNIFAARIFDPVARGNAVDQFMRASGTPAFLATPLGLFTQRVFLLEALEASAGIVGVQNSITFTAFHSQTTALSDSTGTGVPDVFLTADKIDQRGFGVRAEHKVTPFTTVGAGVRRTHSRQQPTAIESRDDYLTLTVNHTLSPKTVASAGVSVTDFSSNSTAFGNRDAKSVFVSLNHRF